MQNQINNAPGEETYKSDRGLQISHSSDVTAADVPSETVVDGMIAEATTKVRRRTKTLGAKIALVATVPLALAAAPVLIYHPSSILATVVTTLYIGALGAAASAIILRDSKQPFPFDIEELIRIGSVKAIGPLIETFDINISGAQSKQRHKALTPLLYKLKASDACLLTPSQYRALHRALEVEYQTLHGTQEGLDLKLAMLKALEQVGNESFISIVERLANRKSLTKRQRMIQAAAQECLPYLKLNAGSVTAQRTLLRASTMNDSSTASLLRPAGYAPDAPVDQLLRPSIETDPSPHE